MIKKAFIVILLVTLLFACDTGSTTDPGTTDPGNGDGTIPETGTSSSEYGMTELPVPASAGSGKVWELQEDLSDDFNYTWNPSNTSNNTSNGSPYHNMALNEDFGPASDPDKWYNYYHNGWSGPGTTYWQTQNVKVDGESLVITASRNSSTAKMGVEGINAGCITSNARVSAPVFVEASVSLANIALASDVWLLSGDDKQELDILEAYGGSDSNNAFFAKFLHLSHHYFLRNDPNFPGVFHDYQPTDHGSWWERSGVTSWGDYSWNGGNRRFVRVGVNWIDSHHFEYYIDGVLVRVLYHNAMATNDFGTWTYTYPTPADAAAVTAYSNEYQTVTLGEAYKANGYMAMTQYGSTSSTFSLATLQAASDESTISVIDPYGYQVDTNGDTIGFTKELDIIINVESQDWHVSAGRTPNDTLLADPSKNNMKVDWIRVYKPVDSL